MKLTIARSGLARANACRSAYPPFKGARAKLFALSGVARSGATRANYTSNRVFIAVGGVQVGAVRPGPGVGVLIDSLTITDQLSSTPTTGAFTARGWVPVDGADVVITLGSINNTRRAFGGTILHTRHRYVGDKPVAANMVYDCAIIDYAWALARRKVSNRFTATTVGAIAASLMTAAPVGYTLQVEADIAAARIDEITFTEQNLDDAIGQLCKRVGGDWQCDYRKVIHVFFTDTVSTPPTLVNAVHKSLAGIEWTRDLSQVVTRVYVDAGGSEALEAIQPGETMIPVGTAVWYETAGGVALAGPQRVKYGAVDLGGGGSLVGPGAAPTAPINALVVPGAGVTAGAHDYAVTYVTVNGESVPSPRVSVAVGVIAPPTAAPAIGSPLLAGTGPDPGAHEYAITYYVPGSGETTPGPRVGVSTDLTPPPTTGPSATLGAQGAGPDYGTHDYAVTFVTASGETTPSPIGGSVTTGNAPIAPPTSAPTPQPPTAGGAVDSGNHSYAFTFLTASGETTPGTYNSVAVGANEINATQGPDCAPSPGGTNAVAAGTHIFYAYTYLSSAGETTPSPATETVTVQYPGYPSSFSYYTAITPKVSNDARVTQIAIYRRRPTDSYNPNWTRIGTVANTPVGGSGNAPAYADDYNISGAAGPPATNPTDPNHTVPITNIATGPAGTTGRRIYRTKASGGGAYLVATINNNSSTTYTDTIADAALGAAVPTTNTAYALVAVNVADIPRGTGNSSGVVTARKLYRRSGGAGLRYLDTIGNNSTTTYTDTKANAALGAAPPATNSATLRVIPLVSIPIGPSIVANRNLYRTKIGSSTLFFVRTLDNVVTTYTDTTNDASLGVAAPSVNNAIASQVQLSAIPLGAAAVTARKLYRTKAGLSQLQLLATLADNTTSAYTDTIADAALGANAPTSDTSALTQPSGSVVVGSTVLPCASVARFRAGGGWAIAGSQLVKYAGITGNSLIGIPATGGGSIAAAISFNNTVVAAPLLLGIPATGVGAIRVPIVKGDPVDLFIQEDDTAAQAALAAQLGGGADGIVEDEIQDRRLSVTEAHARARARLAQLAERDVDGKVGIVSVTYTSRDINTRAGATVSINLGPPVNLRGDYLVQRVTINQFGNPHVFPTYTVEASSVRFTFEELLRVIRDEAA